MSIVAVLVVLGTLGTVALITAGTAQAASASQAKDPCAITVSAENLADNAVQTAINAYQGTGKTVCIGAGIFPEQLTISGSLTLKGTSAAKTTIEPTSLSSYSYDDDLAVSLGSVGLYYGILVGTPCTSGVTLGNGGIACGSPYTPVTGVTIEDLTVNGLAGASSITVCGDNPEGFAGVDFQDASGTLTSSKVVYVAASSPCTPESAVYATNGYLYTGSSPSNSIVVSQTTISSYMKNAITCDDLGEYCSIVSNSVTGSGPNPNLAQNGIQVAFGAKATVKSNHVSGNVCTWSGCGNDWYTTTQATGILLFDVATGTTVSSNTVLSNQIGIEYYADGVSANGYVGPVSVTISHNSVQNSGAYGILASGAPGGGDSVTISSNTINNEESLYPTVWGAPGILVDTGSFTVTGNHILGSQAVSGASNGPSQSDPPGSIATAAIQGASESSGNPTTLYISSNTYTLDSFRLVTLGESGGYVNVLEAS